ncbi:MAG TPA: transcription antitermination factor NusB [Acidobacteriota bacterium]|nr:transcription antitermination factor NusB [Acidobacteriota bacterium]
MRRKAREYAVQALYALDLNPQPVHDFLKIFWEMNPCRESVQEYATTLIRGTVKNEKEIDALIAAHSSNWKIDRMAVTDRNILRLGTFELLEEPSVPSSVVINEAIEIAKKFGTTDSATFINGVLDSIHHDLERKEPRQVS